MRNIKIMHLLFTLGTAGLQKQVVNVINALHGTEGFEFSVCCLEEIRESNYKLPETCKIFVMGKRPGVAYFLPFRLSKLFRTEKVDIVHAHGLATQLYGVIGALLARVPIVVNGEHGGIFQEGGRVRLYVARKLLSYFTKVIHTTSSDLRENLVRLTWINREKVVPILNGVELDRFRKIPNVREGYHFCEAEDMIIGYVGRLEPVKNCSLLLKAIPRVKEQVPRLKVLIVGNGQLRHELENLAHKLSVDGNVHFLGERTDIPELLNLMDIMVLTSVSEGLSNTILEGMACGLPIVASDVGGNPELVDDGVTGFLFPSQDVNALAQKLIILAKDKNKREAMGDNCRRKVEEGFHLDRMISDYKRLYLELADKYIKGKPKRNEMNRTEVEGKC